MADLKSFIFLGDILGIDNQSEIHLFDDYTFKKANDFQINIIKNNIEKFEDIFHFGMNRFEHEKKPNNKNGHTYKALNKKDWNYYIIEHSKIKMDKNLPIVLKLSQLDLTILFEVSYNKSTSGNNLMGISWQQLKLMNFFIDSRFHNMQIKNITNEHQKEIISIWENLKTFNKLIDKFDFIDKALNDFLELSNISKESPFRILGYFSIFELLLTTHRYRTPDNSSLNHQLQKKINLLNNQFENKIDFKKYFKGPDTNTLETIIYKLYQYRNDIAHGNQPDFEGDLTLLRYNRDNISSFLNDLLKKILTYGIQEPQLLKDLKEC